MRVREVMIHVCDGKRKCEGDGKKEREVRHELQEE